jgi:two-component system response regulator MprA
MQILLQQQQFGRQYMARIIVVDDSPDVRSLLQMLLKAEGHDVVAVADGRAALDLDMGSRDIVLLDLMMPEVDGFSVLSQLTGRKDGMPRVIVVTASAGENDRQKSLRLGACGYVAKPFEPDMLIDEISVTARRSEDDLNRHRDHEVYLSRLLSQLERAVERGGSTPVPGTFRTEPVEQGSVR